MKYRGLAIIACTAVLTACMDDDNKTEETSPPPPTFSASTTIEIDLTGKQQVPANISAHMATATIELDETLGLMRASVDVSNVEGVQAAGGHYVNVHTPAYPNGELRGQIQ